MLLEQIINYFKVLLELTADMAPYLLLGFLFAGLLKVFLPQNLMNRYLGKSTFKSVVNASLLGIPLPLCSCGVLPAGISLYKNGASKGSSVSFLISTPQTGVDSILVTWSMLGLPFALIRPIAALFTGVTGGVMTNELEKEKDDRSAGEEDFKPVKQKPSLKAILDYAFVEMMADIAKWLVIGLLIAALIAVVIPDNFFQEFKMSGLLGMLIILVASVPLYICATSSVPIAAVLLMKGLSPGALLVFLMAGPATNAATMTVVGQNLGRKTLFIYLTALIVGSLLFGLFIDYFLPGNWFLPVMDMVGGHEHGLLPAWLNYGSAAILVLLLINSFRLQYQERMKSKRQKEFTPQFTVDIPTMVIQVEGMTCEHCKAKVENGLRSQDNITNAIADTEKNTVKLYGTNLDPQKIGQLVQELGYIFRGQKST
jgi:uncharacterized membrane protein YraQ (UPF0718 family)/copper chaperone CopZ